MSYFVLSHISQNFNQNDSFDFVSKSRLVVKWMTGIKSISITKARNVQRPVSPQGSTLRAAIASNVETDIRLRSVKQMLSLIRMISEKLFLEQLRITFMMHLCHKMFWFATSFLISLHCASWRKNTIFLLGSHRKWWPGAKMVARGHWPGKLNMVSVLSLVSIKELFLSSMKEQLCFCFIVWIETIARPELLSCPSQALLTFPKLNVTRSWQQHMSKNQCEKYVRVCYIISSLYKLILPSLSEVKSKDECSKSSFANHSLSMERIDKTAITHSAEIGFCNFECKRTTPVRRCDFRGNIKYKTET